MRAATHEKHVQEPVPVDVSNPRVDVSDLALRRKTTAQILILILILTMKTKFPAPLINKQGLWGLVLGSLVVYPLLRMTTSFRVLVLRFDEIIPRILRL